MNISVHVATYGDDEWKAMAEQRAVPSAVAAEPFEVVAEHQPDGNVASSRNAAAAHASGEWLCFLDGDDQLEPGFIPAMKAAHERTDVIMETHDVLFTPAVQQLRKGRPRPPFFFPECSLTTGNWLIIGTLVSKSLFDEVGGFDDHPHGLEDWQLWAKCVKAGASIVKVPKAVYIAHYNQKSKHHMLARDRKAYMEAYEKARLSVWG